MKIFNNKVFQYIFSLVFLLPSFVIAGCSSTTVNPEKNINNYTPSSTVNEKSTINENFGCCKICSKGKACGDSCISRSYTCHKPPGCACDAN